MVGESGRGVNGQKSLAEKAMEAVASIAMLPGRIGVADVTGIYFASETGVELPALPLPSPIWRWKKFSISV